MHRESKSEEPRDLRLPNLFSGTHSTSRVSYLTPRLRCSRLAPDVPREPFSRGRSSSCKAALGSFKRSISGLILGLDDESRQASRPAQQSVRESHDWSNLLANSGIRSAAWLIHRQDDEESRLEKQTVPSALSNQQLHERSDAVFRALESPQQRYEKQEASAASSEKFSPVKKRAGLNQTPRKARDRRQVGRKNAVIDGTGIDRNASPDSNRGETSEGSKHNTARRGSTLPVQTQGRRRSVQDLQFLQRADHFHSASPSGHKTYDEGDAALTEGMRSRMAAKRFEAFLSSFQTLVNCENNPVSVAEAVERLRPIACGGSNFAWERNARWGNGGYGASVSINFQIILWYHNWDQPDVKSRVSSRISFLHKAGCAYIYQPCLPLTALVISPRQSFRPMFDMDPRSFHTFKLAWRHFLDFGVSDYRIIVGEQLEQWTQRCKAVIEKPMNAVYWLMLMVGSHYREVLVRRSVLHGFTETFERVPVICVDSFVALSALLFSPERQVLYAGTDPTPSYLQWLQYIADQQASRKEARNRKPDHATVFEINEFLDLSVIIVFYGRIQQKVKESKPLSWVGNPTLIKSYIAQYAEDNRCICQLEQAVRLYTFSSALGEHTASAAGDKSWYCWNGLHVCEIGVPMPSTQATFLSPFITTKSVALLCPQHGPDAERLAAESKERTKKDHNSSKDSNSNDTESKRPSFNESMPFKHSRPASRSARSDSAKTKDGSSSAGSSSDEFDIFTESQDSAISRTKEDVEMSEEGKACSCSRYIKATDSQRKGARRNKPGHASLDPEMVQALQAVAPYDTMHCFIAVLSGCLNHAKQIIRTHFSIDPAAYKNLPLPQRVSWPDAMIPWYREFHKPDAHGRSRYGMLLESLVRGLLGDGYTSGRHDEVLDIMRVQDADQQLEKKKEDGAALNMKAPEAMQGQVAQSKKQVSFPLGGLRRPSQLFGISGRGKSGSLVSMMPGASFPLSIKEDQQHEEPLVSAPAPLSPAGGASLHGAHGHGHRHATEKIRGVIADFMLWSELYESESLYNHRSHFDTFTQWCHSAHLIPFLKRCYRRSGIAGLLPGQRCGGGPNQADRYFPLVLPTIPNFCYGQCYPFHRVLEYFYGGMNTIVASIDDPTTLESIRSNWRLIPGQDRLNNLCWFQLNPREHDFLQQIHENESVRPSNGLNMFLLQQLEDFSSGRSSGKSVNENQLSVLDHDSSMDRASGAPALDLSLLNQLENPHKFGVRSSSHRKTAAGMAVGAGVVQHASPGSMVTNRRGRSTMTIRRAHVSMKTLQGKPGDAKAQRKPPRQPDRIGLLVPEDPFFWFCSHNFALHVYPADYIPKHFLSDGSSLVYAYTDFVSRTGTPEPAYRGHQNRSRGARESVNAGGRATMVFDPHFESEIRHEAEAELPQAEENAIIDGKVVPPSICLCQPTDLSQHARQRWPVEQEFVDDRKLILGDTGWFPGALGSRFSFEATSADVDRYIRLSSMPQAQLLYVEHQLLPQREKNKDKRKDSKGKATLDNLDPDFEHSSDSDTSEISEDAPAGKKTGHGSHASRKRHMLERTKQQEMRRREAAKAAEQNHSMMLPPLLTTKDGAFPF